MYANNYAILITYIALEGDSAFSIPDLRAVLRELPHEGLVSALSVIKQDLADANDSTSEYWENRVVPFFKNIWPKDKQQLTPEVAEQMAGVCIEAGENFANAFKLLGQWLGASKWPDTLIYRMELTENKWTINELATHFPSELLYFLRRIIGDNAITADSVVKKALETIRNTTPTLEASTEFIALAAKFLNK
jgi:hypothetical protein